MKRFRFILAMVGVLGLSSCGRNPGNRVQGYVEGEYVLIASPLAGTLENLSVTRGAQVKPGDLLFSLEAVAEKAARDQAARRLQEAESQWADAKKGQRPSEIASLEARLQQARAALAYSEKEHIRMVGLTAARASSEQDLDRARSVRDQDRDRVTQLESDLSTARLGARDDVIAAHEANVRALTAALARAEWDLTQKRQAAPAAGLIFDTLYRPGEWVPAGRPVISLLPPANVKVRAFVSQTRLGAIQVGAEARVFLDGAAGPLTGKVSFISPQAEYTPPVIYSRESRAKLVFRVEIVFAPEVAAGLHPGQPLDVEF